MILLISLILISAPGILAQDGQSAAQTAEQLRSQLRDLQTEEADLQARLQQLDWDLKPENIERFFAAVGTTRPEELREQRRRQLQIERDKVNARIAGLATSRMRLESAIGTADAEAYRQSAEPLPAVNLGQMLGSPHPPSHLFFAVVVALIATCGALALGAVIRRRQRGGRLRTKAQ